MVVQRNEVFIGRQLEMAALTTALENPLAGHGQLVMLAGQPGIGKTRLARNRPTHSQ